jgi:DNA-binding transcriptional regulator YhcF (GntR family)
MEQQGEEVPKPFTRGELCVARAVSELVKRGVLVGRFGVGVFVAEDQAADGGPTTA